MLYVRNTNNITINEENNHSIFYNFHRLCKQKFLCFVLFVRWHCRGTYSKLKREGEINLVSKVKTIVLD